MLKTKKYNWSDAWLLLSIIYASGGGDDDATLKKIIAAGDWINHAVFNADELESGFARLAAGRFIREKNMTFSATLKVRRAYAENISRGRIVANELKDIERLLGAAAATSDQPNSNNLKYDGFSQAEFRAAVEKYLSF